MGPGDQLGAPARAPVRAEPVDDLRWCTLTVDPNYVDLDGGSVAPAAPRACGGVRIDFANYPTLGRGKTGAGVKALQCLLTQRGKYRKPVDGRYDADVVAAVRAYQRSRSLPVTGVAAADTWEALRRGRL